MKNLYRQVNFPRRKKGAKEERQFNAIDWYVTWHIMMDFQDIHPEWDQVHFKFTKDIL